VITLAVDPSGQSNGLANVRRAQFCTGMRAIGVHITSFGTLDTGKEKPREKGI
jgi:hypothetical protein